MASGVYVAKPVSGLVRCIQLNMEENLKDAVSSANSNIGAEMKQYWENVIYAKDP
jgi:hypothetical protein